MCGLGPPKGVLSGLSYLLGRERESGKVSVHLLNSYRRTQMLWAGLYHEQHLTKSWVVIPLQMKMKMLRLRKDKFAQDQAF